MNTTFNFHALSTANKIRLNDYYRRRFTYYKNMQNITETNREEHGKHGRFIFKNMTKANIKILWSILKNILTLAFWATIIYASLVLFLLG